MCILLIRINYNLADRHVTDENPAIASIRVQLHFGDNFERRMEKPNDYTMFMHSYKIIDFYKNKLICEARNVDNLWWEYRKSHESSWGNISERLNKTQIRSIENGKELEINDMSDKINFTNLDPIIGDYRCAASNSTTGYVAISLTYSLTYICEYKICYCLTIPAMSVKFVSIFKYEDIRWYYSAKGQRSAHRRSMYTSLRSIHFMVRMVLIDWLIQKSSFLTPANVCVESTDPA